MLVRRGADIFAKDTNGKTAYDHAVEHAAEHAVEEEEYEVRFGNPDDLEKCVKLFPRMANFEIPPNR